MSLLMGKVSDFLKIGVAAAGRGNLETVRLVLAERPDWLLRVGSHGRTMLWEAAYRGRLAMVEWLLDQGADVHAWGCHFTPLLVDISPYCAAQFKKHDAVADVLLARGASTDIYTFAYLGDGDAVAECLHPDPGLATVERVQHDTHVRATVLHYAVGAGYLDIVCLLLEQGAEPRPFSKENNMKARIVGEQQADVVPAPVPEPKEDWAVVKVHASAMCTEYKAWMAGDRREVIGHEGAGEVVAVAQPGRVQVGDRVTVMPQYPCGNCALCRAGDYIYCEDTYNFAEFTGSREGSGTFAHYVVKPSWLLLPIPERVTYEQATMAIDGIGASFGGMQAIGVGAFDTVLITGLGPVGLGGVINARFRGARVLAVEPAPWRAALGLELGAEVVLHPQDDPLARIRDLTDGRGVDCAVDCSGSVAGERLCIDAVRRRGRVAFVGECSQDLPIKVSPDLIRKGLLISGNWLYNMQDYEGVMQVIAESPLIDKLISHVMPMSKIQEAFGLLSAGEAAKIVLHPWA